MAGDQVNLMTIFLLESSDLNSSNVLQELLVSTD